MPRRSVELRLFAVAILASFGLLATLPGIMLVRHPVGTYGLTVDADGIVRDVDPESAAAQAGIKLGDEVTGPLKKPVGEIWVASPGIQTALTVVHEGQPRQVTLVARPTRFAPGDAFLYPLRKIIAALFIVVGALLLLARPSLATWGFFLYCIGDNPFATSGVLFANLPHPWYVLFIVVRDLLNAAGITGLLLFALNFPGQDVAPWRGTLQRYVWWLPALLAGGAIAVNLTAWLGHPIQWLLTALSIVRTILYAGIAGIFLETYLRSRGEDRQRVAWITFGFAVGLVGLAFAHTLNVVHWSVASNVSLHERLLSLLIGVVPFAVAYSVVRHHVFDFNVVISHALVYGVLTAIVIAFFSMLHAVAVRTLHSAGASLGVELLAAVVLGFSLEAIQQRLEWLISTLFFRRRRLAARHIAAAAATLPRSTSKEAVDADVVAAPVKAFDLGSAALFRRDESGAYMRRSAFGWSATDDAAFFPDDELVVALQRDRVAVDLEKRHLPRSGMPSGELVPTLACPLIVRGQLEAFALYGPQAGGAALERDQIPALHDLMQAAALAYDELEFAFLRARAAQVCRLQEELDALKSGTQVQPM